MRVHSILRFLSIHYYLILRYLSESYSKRCLGEIVAPMFYRRERGYSRFVEKGLRWWKMKEIGGGTFGTVYRACIDGKEFAVKKYTYSDEPLHHTTVREIKTLRKLNSPYVLKIVKVIVYNYRVYAVFPYYPDDLSKLLAREPLTLTDCRSIFRQILKGIEEVHNKGLIHRDIKPGNILIKKVRDKSPRFHACVCDFGMTKVCEGNMTPGVVTLWYRAPEVLLGSLEYGTSADVWSLGCILYEMLKGGPLFKGNTEVEQIDMISRMCGTINKESIPNCETYPFYKNFNLSEGERRVCESMEEISASAADLFDKIMVLDPSARLSIAQCLEHPFVKECPEGA